MTAVHGMTKMLHERDPREALMSESLCGSVDVLHNNILVAIYVRPDKTHGGIALPERIRKEDVYQGKVGIVLKKGPLAFVDDDRNKFAGKDVNPGDWIAFRAQDGWTLDLQGVTGPVPCRVLEDVHVKMVLVAPDAIY